MNAALRLLPIALLALALPAGAQDIDGGIDQESLLEKARPRVRDMYLHPDAIDAEAMLRAALQRLEHESPQILVTEPSPEEIAIRVMPAEGEDGEPSERVIRTVGVDLDETFDLVEVAALWVHSLLADDADVTMDDLRAAGLTGMLRTIDRHSSVIAGDRLDDFNTRYQGTLVGIGARIGQRDGGLRILKPFPDTPAARAGLRRWDMVTHVDGVSTEAMSVDDAVGRIRGPKDVPVVLTVKRGEEERVRTFVIVRDQVPVPSSESTMLADNIGYVGIDHFSKKTSSEVQTHIDDLRRKAMRGLIIDLRGNQGGSMIHAARIVNNFVDTGVLVQTEGPDGGKVKGLTWKVAATKPRKRFDGPVVVLVDGRTASGSEIVAGGLKFLERGLILGSQTFGKGTVQKVYRLTDDVSMKLTVARYLLPGEKFINHVGVTPDVAVGQLWLDPVDPTVPDEFVEPPSLAGLEDREGGLDARRNPGAGRAPTAGGINAAPKLRLLYPRVLSSWAGEEAEETPDATPEPPEAETPAADTPAIPDELQGDEKVRSNLPGDAGEERYNDVPLALAHAILAAAKPTDRRAELITAATPIVDRWQQEQAKRLQEGLAVRAIPWTPSSPARWLDRAPALEDEVASAFERPQPDLNVTMDLPKALQVGEDQEATLTVKNTSDVPWKRLRARLESSSAALDDGSFVIGDLDPGDSRTTSIRVRASTRDESRLDVWRLYLLDDDGPLGAPWRGTVRTEGLPPTRLEAAVTTSLQPEDAGGVLIDTTIRVRSADGTETGDVRIYFGRPQAEGVERTERFRTLDPVSGGDTSEGTLSLRVRDPAAVGTVPIRLYATDLRTGDRTTVELEIPTGSPLTGEQWHTPATGTLSLKPSGAVREPHEVRGTVSVDDGQNLASVEVLLDGDKLFTRRVAPGEAVSRVDFDVRGPLDVGPNLVLVRTRTAEGVSWSAKGWVLGEP